MPADQIKLKRPQGRFWDATLATMTRICPGANSRVALRELRNKLEIFYMVKDGPKRFEPWVKEPVPLSSLVERTTAQESFGTAWELEGLSYCYTLEQLRRTESPEGLLNPTNTAPLSRSYLTLLHAGMGLALANRCFATVAHRDDTQVREAVTRFVQLCQRNSQDEYVGVTLESMGPAVRMLYRDLIPALDDHLRSINAEWCEYFWHGVGRATYFATEHVWPWRQLNWRKLDRIAPREIEKNNLMAGLAWAMTLVNIRHPQVLERLLATRKDTQYRSAAFFNGVTSALVVALDVVQDVSIMDDFAGHRVVDAKLASLWDGCFTNALESAKRLQPSLRRRHLVGQVYRYQDLNYLING